MDKPQQGKGQLNKRTVEWIICWLRKSLCVVLQHGLSDIVCVAQRQCLMKTELIKEQAQHTIKTKDRFFGGDWLAYASSITDKSAPNTPFVRKDKEGRVLNLAGHQHDGEASKNTDSRVHLLETPNQYVWGGCPKSVSTLFFNLINSFTVALGPCCCVRVLSSFGK